MRDITVVYPGCFTPPTYGHFYIAKKAAEIFENVTIICSTNKEKDKTRWFSEEECKLMWQHYPLAQNISIKTFAEYVKFKTDHNKVIMVRGIRNEEDMENEKRVMKLNKELFGIKKFFYILSEDHLACISATKVRRATQELDFQTLANCVSPAIVTILLEKFLRIKNLFMVVGKPGSGKSTIFKKLSNNDSTVIHIDTDLFSQKIRPLILDKFGKTTDLVTLAIERDKELTNFIAPLWFQYLADALRNVPQDTHVFLEIPYGLQAEKELFRYVGHKVVYVGCASSSENYQRIIQRNSPQHVRFMDKIPDLTQSIEIAVQNHLKMHIIDTSGDLNSMQKKIDDFHAILTQKK